MWAADPDLVRDRGRDEARLEAVLSSEQRSGDGAEAAEAVGRVEVLSGVEGRVPDAGGGVEGEDHGGGPADGVAGVVCAVGGPEGDLAAVMRMLEELEGKVYDDLVRKVRWLEEELLLLADTVAEAKEM